MKIISDIRLYKSTESNTHIDIGNKEINIADSLLFMNYGIPQGLPQSFFFGNLCMLEIKRIMIKDEYFKGEAFFYVDDSVIYIQEKLDDYSFKTKIKKDFL